MGRNPRDRFRLFVRELRIIHEQAALDEARLERQLMSYISETPFDNIESSHQYVSLLADAIEEARREVEEEIALSMTEGESADRRKEALQIVAYNLAKLSLHIKTSGRILNDLRSLRRLLLAEREPVHVHAKAAGIAGS